MPCDYLKYPKDWKNIRDKILTRSNHTCEECGVKNYSIGARDREGNWYDEDRIQNMNSGMGLQLFGDFPKMIKIVLTIAHKDHNIQNNDESNLASWCQKCHLKHDQALHIENSRKTRERKSPQILLFSKEVRP
jgi:5-methylcytosine-specific restriction endonuclease McrA